MRAGAAEATIKARTRHPALAKSGHASQIALSKK
jgi:hypothetical protein